MDQQNLSYDQGEEDDFVAEGTISFYVDKWAIVYPDKEAYVFRPSESEREAITYADLKVATEKLAIWLRREFHLQKGDRVGILSINRLQYVLCELALAKLGVVVVRIYVSMDSKDDLTRSLKLTDCRLFFCQYDSLKSAGNLVNLDQHDPKERLVSSELPTLEHVMCLTGEPSPGTIPVPEWRTIEVSDAERNELEQIQKTVALDDDCSIYSTSGSTGVPKFVVLSHESHMHFPRRSARIAGFDSTDRFFSDRPLAHLGGAHCFVLVAGATMVMAHTWKTVGSDGASEYLTKLFRQERVTCGLSLSYVLYDLVKSGNITDEIRNGKFFLFGGQAMNPEIIRTLKSKLHVPLCSLYGSTEMSDIVCTKPDDPCSILEKYAGKALPGTAIKIVDPETRSVLPRGESGAIAVKPAHKWYYLNNEAKMKELHDEDGFYYQGDMGRMGENGYIQIMGREDDMMSVGTVKVYPGPIEMMLCKHPAVDKAIVFGVPDPRLYEVIGAGIILKPGYSVTSQDLINFTGENVDKNDLMTGSAYVPKFIWIEDKFPMTSSGKVDKKGLRAQCIEKLKSS